MHSCPWLQHSGKASDPRIERWYSVSTEWLSQRTLWTVVFLSVTPAARPADIKDNQSLISHNHTAD